MEDPSNIEPFPRKRTYLDACREQGVFQKDEETRAEIFESRGQIAAMKTEHRHATGRLAGTPNLKIVGGDEGPEELSHDAIVEVQAGPVMARVQGIMDLYAEAGMGDAHFPLLRHLICNAPITVAECDGLFEAALIDRRKTSAPGINAPDHDAYDQAWISSTMPATEQGRQP